MAAPPRGVGHGDLSLRSSRSTGDLGIPDRQGAIRVPINTTAVAGAMGACPGPVIMFPGSNPTRPGLGLLVALALTLCLAPVAGAATYAVDQAHPGASDHNSGTTGQPFQTIGAAAARA